MGILNKTSKHPEKLPGVALTCCKRLQQMKSQNAIGIILDITLTGQPILYKKQNKNEYL